MAVAFALHSWRVCLQLYRWLVVDLSVGFRLVLGVEGVTSENFDYQYFGVDGGDGEADDENVAKQDL